ncbi:MAG: carboxypeptidase-like regulatory domain-containing protein [Bacteroidales bacterium]|nr:carboxypeptidase-like regulatory domain-containing protein [Bacteroidales bacterium]
MKTIFVLTLMMFNVVLIAQEKAMIKGRVLDDLGGPLPGANIVTKAYGKLMGTTTDNDGYFTLKPLPEGKYDLKITFVGMADYTLKAINVSNGQIYMVGTLKMQADNMLPAVVVSTKAVIDPDQTINKMEIRQDVLRTMPHSGGVLGIVRALSSDVQVDENNKIILRGSRPGNSITIVDGVKTLGEVNVPSVAISSVTVYSGGVPARYGDFTGGVVLIQTKSFFDFYYEYH